MSGAIDTLRGLPGFKGNPDSFTARCPGHEDLRNSLQVRLMEGGKVSVTCFAGCELRDVLAPLDLRPRDLYPANGNGKKRQFYVAYDYTDAAGKLVFQAVRWKPKSFSQRRPDPDKPGAWIWNLDGIERPLYRLPEIVKAKAEGRTVFLCEGEKDADNVAALGLCATTNAGGAAKWTKADAATLEGADVVVLADNDAPGIHGAWKRADSLQGAVVLLLPGLPDKGDVSDWLAAGGTREQLEDMVAHAQQNPPARPQTATTATTGTKASEATDVDPLSDVAMAGRLAALAPGDVLHATDRGWLCWDGRRFASNSKAAQRLAAKVGTATRRDGQALTDNPDTIKGYYRAAKRAESAAGIEATLKIAATLDGIDADGIEFDSDAWALNCVNGTVDLRTGDLRPHRREDYNTKLCPHTFDPAATCPRWLQFLNEVFEGDRQVIEWMHWLCGYTATGATHRHLLPILHGDGRNGKSVLFKALRNVLGTDYAVTVDPEDLMAKSAKSHNHSIPRLRGARFAMAQETAENRRIDEALVKTLTGGDPITARELYGALFEFTPTHTLWMATNYRPRITGSASGIWERVRLVPFDRRFQDAEQDPDLDNKLSAEAAGILAWLVAGARMPEPPVPARVRAATDAYREESDTLAAFLDEYLTDEWEQATVPKRAVYDLYRRDRNNHCEGFKEFNARLEKKGLEGVRKNDAYCWRGVSIRAKYTTRDVP